MVDIAKQIQTIIDERFNRNKAAFARAVDIKPTTLASYLNPKRASKPTSDFLTAVVEKTGIDATWLLTGMGSMDGSTTSIKQDTQSGLNNNGDDNLNINMPCLDDMSHIRDLEREVERLQLELEHKSGLLIHKDDLIKELRESANKQIAQLEKSVEHLQKLNDFLMGQK